MTDTIQEINSRKKDRLSEKKGTHIKEVFARFKYDKLLHCVGRFNGRRRTHEGKCLQSYNEWAWIKVIIGPREETNHVIETP